MMEPSKPEAEVGEKCNINGNCSPPPKKPIIDVNHAKNIDDISTPSELKFDEDFDFVDPDITEKRREIEECLADLDGTNLEQWQNFAKSKGGLISDEYRRKIWPLLVVLDVNRSLKRFPPGIPYEQRVALQDQLTGYHDVAITLLLVCGDRASFPLLCRLSAGVGTMFALPWYLTWFGHSLNRYADVVRLYDYFLCAPPLFPVYVTAAIVLHRQEERRRAAAAAARNPPLSVRLQRTLQYYVPALRYPLTRRAILATATVLIGVYVYYRPDLFNR
ncbi:hypothetical protein MSG28_002527 [Choristoneura fumiferana]|uniref:Uncharacterized protein n=1 Tax=Choristoneura fumiferana TaxID=7141 RepID=A0ACC0JWN6_CHOFU|nr:hypothetical protein MSG28_002527 [Choristoneura fumiferana]